MLLTHAGLKAHGPFQPTCLQGFHWVRLLMTGTAIVLAGCQNQPLGRHAPPLAVITPVTPPATTVQETPASATPTQPGAKVSPLPADSDTTIKRYHLPAPPATVPSPPMVAPLPNLSPPPQPKVVLRDGSTIPAFAHLIQRAQQQIQANQLNGAEQTLIQAQRMAPQSTAVYAHLSHVALKKGQASNAEAMARKGLMLTSNPRQQHAFWQLILASAQLGNNHALAAQARQQIQQLAGQF